MEFPSLDKLLGLTWKDGWQHGNTYFEKDAVLFEGSVYVAIGNNHNVPPTDTGSWTLFSKYIATAGFTEDLGNRLPLNIASNNPILVTQPVAFTPPPPLSEWTWLNHGPYDDATNYPLEVTAEDMGGSIRFTVPGPTNWPGVILTNDPLPNPPYTITMAFRCGLLPRFTEVKIPIRNSTTGYTISAGIFADTIEFWRGNISDLVITSTTIDYQASFNQVSCQITDLPNVLWLRVQNDGSEIHLFLSNDGLSFMEILGLDSSAFGSMDQYGVALYNLDAIYDSPATEKYRSRIGYDYQGRVTVDLLSLEVVEELVTTTSYTITPP